MSSPRAVPALSPERALVYRARFDAVRAEGNAVRAELASHQERRLQIGLSMKEQGCSYQEIADVLGVSRSYARDLVVDPRATARRARSARSRRVEQQRRAASTSLSPPTARVVACDV